MKKPLLLFPLLILALCNCSKENNPFPDTDTEKAPVRFSSILLENDITRASGTIWDNGDEIGVFAVKHQSVLQSGNIIDNNENLPFVTTNGDGFFYAKSQNIYYPDKDASMDIIAYYPYKSDLNGYDYPVDITGQPEIFYSNNLKDISKDNPNNGLQFRRILSKIVFNVTPDIGERSLEGLTVSISGAKTLASFSLADGTLSVDEQSVKSIPMTISGDNDQKQASVVVLPSVQVNEISARFTVGDKTYIWTVPHALEAGKVYRYDIKLDGLSPIAGMSSPYMELPVYTTSGTAPYSAAALHMVGSKTWLNSSYVDASTSSSIRNYSILFDTENRIPYWVAYPMHPMYMASGNRTDEWGYDPIIPTSVQPVLYSGWSGQSLDRGHLLASADRNATRAINRTTFYFTNMAPQNSSMNSGTWSQLETKVRFWSEQSGYDTLYVVTGCILPKTPEPLTYAEDNDGKKSAVPKYLYKALLRKNNSTGTYSSIAFKMENAYTGIPYTDSRNIISIAELETETGFTFFPNLPADVAPTVKQNKAMAPDWN